MICHSHPHLPPWGWNAEHSLVFSWLLGGAIQEYQWLLRFRARYGSFYPDLWVWVTMGQKCVDKMSSEIGWFLEYQTRKHVGFSKFWPLPHLMLLEFSLKIDWQLLSDTWKICLGYSWPPGKSLWCICSFWRCSETTCSFMSALCRLICLQGFGGSSAGSSRSGPRNGMIY